MFCRSNVNVIPVLSDILSESVKEKVTRIILATFRVSQSLFFYVDLTVASCEDGFSSSEKKDFLKYKIYYTLQK